MQFLVDNWAVVVGVMVAAGAGIMVGVRFFRLPAEQQLGNIKKWMLWAVVQAEKELGTGTGRLKLSYVYNMFLTKFPSIAVVLPFERFSALVNEALVEMKQLMTTNEAIRAVIENTHKPLY